jgi:hypothetical protein
MNSNEIKALFELASQQFDIRVARLKRLYGLNAADTIIQKEIELIQEAGARITLYSLPYEQLISKLPAAQGSQILKDLSQKDEMEELMRVDEKKWSNVEDELKLKFPESIHIISSMIEIMKDKAMLY